MAFHAIKAGEGDQYIAAGVEAVSRFPPHPPFDPHPNLSGEPYNVYIPMGLTAENVAKRCNVSRERRTSGARSARIAPSRRATPATSTPRSCPVGDVSRATTARAPGTTLEKLAELKPVFDPGERHRHGRQLVPAQRRRRRGPRHAARSKANALA